MGARRSLPRPKIVSSAPVEMEELQRPWLVGSRLETVAERVLTTVPDAAQTPETSKWPKLLSR